MDVGLIWMDSDDLGPKIINVGYRAWLQYLPKNSLVFFTITELEDAFSYIIANEDGTLSRKKRQTTKFPVYYLEKGKLIDHIWHRVSPCIGNYWRRTDVSEVVFYYNIPIRVWYIKK